MVEGTHEPEKKALPRLDIKTKINHSPHVAILGAGASRACCPRGDKNGRQLPLMADFVEKVGIKEIVESAGYKTSDNFEHVYSQIHSAGKQDVIEKLDLATLRQLDYPGGIQIWGSNPAIIWSSEKPEEEGIHVHAHKRDGELADPDETFSAVEIDGVKLDPVMVRTLMAQNSLPHLQNRVVPLECDCCGAMEFSEGEQAFTPVVERTCSKCGGHLSGPTRLRRTIGNPLIAILERLARSAPRPPQKHATTLLPETV